MPPTFHPAALVLRAVGFASTDDIECPRPKNHRPGDALFGEGSITLRELMIYVSAPCLLVTIISCWFLSWRHLHRYTSPQEQRQILRIINLPVAYSLFNFLALTFVRDYLYIEPLGQVYEAFTVAALFFLILEYVAPDGVDREKYFDNLEMRSRRGRPLPGGSLKWFQVSSQQLMRIAKSILTDLEVLARLEHCLTISPTEDNRCHHPGHHAVFRRLL